VWGEERADVAELVAMAGYSLLLMAALVVGAPWWVGRMLFSAGSKARYREGLGERLGRVPVALRDAVRGRRVVWVHAVSVGEVLAATRLVGELERRLVAEFGEGWTIVVSTTTATGQALARERFGAGLGDVAAGEGSVGSGRVFYYPLDFAWAVRAYLRVLRPELVVLMESEIWPRMLVECGRRGVPVAVVNARVSDRSFARGVRVKAVWGWVLRRVDLFLAQSEEDGRRLVGMGARASSVKAIGNLKYDVRAAKESRVAELIVEVAAGRSIIVAGSTVGGKSLSDLNEEEIVLKQWQGLPQRDSGLLLVLAPRHPERFPFIRSIVDTFYADASELESLKGPNGFRIEYDVIVLDTIGDLAAVYGVADVAFVGGSLVKRGGHNPLEPAQFGVPVVMGPSFENFRDVVGKMVAADGIRIVQDDVELGEALVELLADRDAAKAMGERGRAVFEAQSGATGRAVEALVELVRAGDELVRVGDGGGSR
jgi:3-deoxy-D-manno-octulosonic-acid transferase